MNQDRITENQAAC